MLNNRSFSRWIRQRGRRGAVAAAVWLLPLLLVTASLLFAPNAFAQQDKSFHNDRYDSNIAVNPDGSLDIKETLVYVYNGSYHLGSRFWDTSKLNDITNIQVSELQGNQEVPYRQGTYIESGSGGGTPGTFGVADTASNQKSVSWVYNYTSYGDTKTFLIRYHVDGAIRVYSDHDQFDWYAVPPEWSGPINSSRVQVTFPQGFNASSLQPGDTAQIPVNAEVSKSGNTITWSYSGNLQASGFEVGAKIPPGIMTATAPSWQAGVDAQENYNIKIRPAVNLAVLFLSFLIAVGGILLVVMHWYTKGRDKPVKMFSDYITEPPSNLPPGLVGTLIDESADVRDVIATVVDLARKGDLTMQELENKGLLTSSKDFEYRHTANKVDYHYEELVLGALFDGRGDDVKLSDLKDTFYNKLPPIYDEMYNSLVALKYFPENPKAVRGRNVGIGVLLIIVGGIVAFFGGAITGLFTDFGWLVGVAIALVGLVWAALAGAMPRKTDLGAEETAKWHAFGRYLVQMQKYTDVQQAADKFQQYLPYAVALGIESQLIQQFNSVPSAMPAWYMPFGYYPYGYFPMGVGGSQQMASQGGGGAGMPTLDPGAAMQNMSNSLGGAMQGMSDSFTTMVNSASSILTSQPQSSGSSGGGGWGGGGGGFGGGGGGGGGGGAS